MKKRKKEEEKQDSDATANLIAGENMAKMFSKIVNDIMQNVSSNNDEPLVYGINIRFTKEGFPIIEDFQNIRAAGENMPVRSDPLVDVIDGKNDVSIILEARDINKDWINVIAKQNSVTIRITDENVSNVMSIDLPAQVNPRTARATFSNGILEITARKDSKTARAECDVKINPV